MFGILFISILFCISSPASGQIMTVKSVTLQPTDDTAITQPCLDNNGDTCALLKIKTEKLVGLKFPNHNQYIKAEYVDGIYYVYIPALNRKLDLLHSDYLPLQLDMSDYGYKRLRSGKTYLITLNAPHKTELTSILILKINPRSAMLYFDGKGLTPSSNGIYEIPVLVGTHEYTINAQNYHSKTGYVSIEKPEVRTLSITLLPITHKVAIKCNVNKARVFVDNIDYGKVGNMYIPQGYHNIRVQADGYVDVEQDVNISVSTKSLSFKLKENKRSTHIHATPVTITSESEKMYKNNKQIKGWISGVPVMIMPGKYLLSNGHGKNKKIVVGSQPMDVKL